MPIARDTAKPNDTANRSFKDISTASLHPLPTLRILIDNSRPASNPMKHQVVDIGIFDQILKTNSITANMKSIIVASGMSVTRDFSSTTL